METAGKRRSSGIKQQGYKTEPAFALLLEIQDNPYNIISKNFLVYE